LGSAPPRLESAPSCLFHKPISAGRLVPLV